MTKIITIIAIAIVLGVTVMLVPIMAFTYHYSITKTMDSNELEGTEDNGEFYGAQGLEATYSAAQRYGKMETEPVPFPSSLLHVMLVIASGLIAAAGVALYFRKRMEFFRSLFNI